MHDIMCIVRILVPSSYCTERQSALHFFFFFKQLEGHVKDTDKNILVLQIHTSTTSVKMYQKLRIL